MTYINYINIHDNYENKMLYNLMAFVMRILDVTYFSTYYKTIFVFGLSI